MNVGNLDCDLKFNGNHQPVQYDASRRTTINETTQYHVNIISMSRSFSYAASLGKGSPKRVQRQRPGDKGRSQLVQVLVGLVGHLAGIAQVTPVALEQIMGFQIWRFPTQGVSRYPRRR